MHLYAAGSNGSGQLAIGNQDDISTFTPTQFHPSVHHLLPNSTIADLVSSSTHALLLLRTQPSEPGSSARNILLGAGANTLGQLGPKCLLWEGSKPVTKWKPVDFLSGLGKGGHEEWEAVKTAVTWTTSFVVYRKLGQEGGVGGLEKGAEGAEEIVVSCGSNDFGELGRGDAGGGGAASDLPTLVDLGMSMGETVQMLRGGQRHVLALVSDREGQRVVGWGANRKGELDPSSTGESKSEHNASDRSSGRTEDGRSKGKGKAPAKGTISIRQPYLPPTTLYRYPPNITVLDIQLGASHSLILHSNHTLLAWGSNAKSQISNLHALRPAISQIATTWNGSYLIFALPPDRQVLMSQGSNTQSQLLRSAEDTAQGWVELPPGREVRSTKAGSEHLLVHCSGIEGDELWVGGWNEHGNLGLGDRENRGQLVRVDLASLGVDKGKVEIKGVWGGCGTSWVWLA